MALADPSAKHALASLAAAAVAATTAPVLPSPAGSESSWSVLGASAVGGSAAAAPPHPAGALGVDLPDEISGDVLARAAAAAAAAAAPADSGGASGKAAGGATAGDAIRSLLAREAKHELVALMGRELTVNWANYNRFKAHVDPSAPVMVVSFLGDTSVGKSTTIAGLMADGEERPHVQRGRDQTASTTFNVNLYASAALADGLAVNFLDFEGESGSETPLMAGGGQAHASAAGGGGKGGAGKAAALAAGAKGLRDQTAYILGLDVSARHSSPLARAEAVREFFPKLAYCLSDVVVLIGTEPFFSTRYLERAVSFAKRANAGVADVDLPVLVLLSNKRAPDECELDIQRATELFTSRMGPDMAQLESYFSAVICADIPHSRGVVRDDEGRVWDGAEAYRVQMDKLRLLLASLVRQRMASRESSALGGAAAGGAGAQRLITSRHGLWFAMLPRVLRHINAGDAVHVSHLVDSAWLSSVADVAGHRDQALDVYKAVVTYARPPRALSAGAPRLADDVQARFAAFHGLVTDVAVRITAARLRSLDPSLLLPGKVHDFARAHVDGALRLLADVTPCRAVYGAGALPPGGGSPGTPVDRPGEPVACLTECRSHARSHRGSRPVRGGGSSLWQRLMNLLPYNPVWPGAYEAMMLDVPPTAELVDAVTEALHLPPADWIAGLAQLQRVHSASGLLRVEYAPLGGGSSSSGNGGAGDAAPAAKAAAPAAVIVSPSGIRLRPSPPVDPRAMPYCVSCSRKVAVPGAPAPLSSAAAGAAGSPDADGGASSADADAGFRSWLVGVFSSASSSAPAAAAVAAPGGKAAAGKHGATAAAGGAPVQEVVFGLCAGCFAAAKEY